MKRGPFNIDELKIKYIDGIATQYVYEMKNVDFKTLTNLFMKVRYGGYAATIQMYDEAKRLSDLVLKGGRG